MIIISLNINIYFKLRFRITYLLTRNLKFLFNMKKLYFLLLIFFLGVGMTNAQRVVTGNIVDDSGVPVIGANVVVKGTTVGTITDFDGNFSLNVPDDAQTLVVSYTGFATQEASLDGSNVLNFIMNEGELLNEVVVTGLGISREEKTLGYSTQSVDGGLIESAKETNIVNSMQGRVAGMQIQGTQSALGGSSRVTIRGSSSFLGENQPLFVIDGVPIDNSNFASNSQQLGFGGASAYDYGNMAQDIDPSIVENVSILKGAAAAALYGQRGANGVILITTKDGSKTKGIGVEFNSTTTFDQAFAFIPHQNQYGGGATNPDTEHGFNEVIVDGETFKYPSYSKDGSWGPKFEGQDVRHWDSWDPNAANFGETRPWEAPANPYTDFFRTGTTLNNNVTLTGGNENGSVRFGYTNLDQQGVLPNSRLQRNSFNLNSNYKLAEWLKVGVSGNYINNAANNRNITGYNNGNPMQAFNQWWQTQLDDERLQNSTWVDGTQNTWNSVGPQRDADGNLLFYDASPNFFDNPYWVADNYLQEDNRNRFFGNANATIDLAEGLSATGRMGTDYYQFSTRNGIPIASVETALYNESEIRFQETNLEGRLNYTKTFSDNFSMSAMAGGNIMRQLSRRTDLNSNGGLSLEGFYNISNSAAAPTIATNESQRGINSVFGQVNFGFMNMLYLDLTARNDWSSTLPEGENSYFYPSAAASFVVSELPAIQNISAIEFLKVRASYAQVGNDAAPYRLVDVYDPIVPNLNGLPRYGVPNSQNNPNLRPEATSEFEVGMDLRLFQGRLGFDFAYFDRSTKDQIFSVPSSASTGYTSRITNAGEMRNWGYEFQITGTPVQTKKFSWDLGINAFRQYNEVVSLEEGIESIARGNTWAASLRIAEGVPYMALYGQDYIRESYELNDDGEIISNEGAIVVDENGYPTFTPDRVFLGSAIADWVGGVSSTFNFGPLSIGGLVDFQRGGVVHSTSLQWSKYSGMHPETVAYMGEEDIRANGFIYDGVKEDGSANDIRVTDPQTYYQSIWRAAAPNVYSASFVKLRELRMDFRIPTNSISFLRGASVGIFGRNLAILSADLPYLDPQGVNGAGNDQGLENAQVPSTRSFGVNLSIKL